MHEKIKLLSICLLFLFVIEPYSADQMINSNTGFGPYDSDFFIHPGFSTVVVESDTVPVKIKWKHSSYSPLLGELYLMVFGEKDSSIFIFHNKLYYDTLNNQLTGSVTDSVVFPEDTNIVNLGFFPKGRELYFMYISNDTSFDSSSRYYDYIGRKIYSGRNREGIERYCTLPADKDRWVVYGWNDTLKEMGIGDLYEQMSLSLVVEIEGVLFTGTDTYKVPHIHSDPAGIIFNDSLSVELYVPDEGLNRYIVNNNNIKYVDTISTLDSGAVLEIYYTIDGTEPDTSTGTLYEEPVKLTETTTLKARAYLKGDSGYTWIPSDLMTETYTCDKVRNIYGKKTLIKNRSIEDISPQSSIKIYNTRGRQLFDIPSRSFSFDNIKSQLRSGMYVMRYNTVRGVRTRKVMVSE